MREVQYTHWPLNQISSTMNMLFLTDFADRGKKWDALSKQ